MILSVSELRMLDGTRRGSISDNGLLMYYPNLFISSEMRQRSKNTHVGFLHNLKVLFLWLSYEGIDLEARFAKNQHLSEKEIHRLVDFCAWTAETHKKLLGSAALLPTAYMQVKRAAYFQRVTAIRKYMDWLYSQLATESGKREEMARVKATMRSLAPNMKNHGKNEHVEVNDEQIEIITNKLMPGHPENPWRSKSDQYRNLLIFHLLYETGIRRGELLGLYVSDISDCGVAVYRRHNNPIDLRKNQPNAKTGERTIPIPRALEMFAYDYVMEYRRKFNRAKKHPYLFVSHKKGAGNPLSIAAVDWIFRTARKAFPELKNLSAHKLRHHMNYRISNMIDEKWGHLSPEDRAIKDQEVRSYLNGWSPEGKQAARYNRRYNVEEAGKAMVERAENYEKGRDNR
ncbi:site-specific integrase [Marinobacter sp. NFXS11]|uniref:site-specific integrase n=1 Tax=Marinobacter sp. NFXS11 TaxID=2818432 RepID=UPI0032DEB789